MFHLPLSRMKGHRRATLVDQCGCSKATPPRQSREPRPLWSSTASRTPRQQSGSRTLTVQKPSVGWGRISPPPRVKSVSGQTRCASFGSACRTASCRPTTPTAVQSPSGCALASMLCAWVRRRACSAPPPQPRLRWIRPAVVTSSRSSQPRRCGTAAGACTRASTLIAHLRACRAPTPTCAPNIGCRRAS